MQVYSPLGHKPGFGNLLMNLCVCKMQGVERIHRSVLDFEFGNCFIIHGFTIVDFEGDQPVCHTYINPSWHQFVWPLSRDIIKPTPHLQELTKQHMHLLDGVTLGVNIRRGNYSEDSVQLSGTTEKKFFFCSDSGLAKFVQAIDDAAGRVYVTSDSPSTKQFLKNKFGEKVTMVDTVFAHTAEQTDPSSQTVKNLQDVYLVWYLLSLCPKVLCTGGTTDLVGFSTFGYMAAVYGSKPMEIIFNGD